MAIALDTSTNGGTATATSLTFSHTCTGNDLALFVAAYTNTTNNTDYITGVTYNGVSMTQVDSFHSPGLGGHELYILLAPATGANNVVISASASVAIYGASASYTGVKQTGQPEASNGGPADPATTRTINNTTLTDNSWLVSTAGKKAGTSVTISAGTNTTSRQINSHVSIGDSNGPQSPTGSYGQTWNISGSSGIDVIACAIAPAATFVPRVIII